MLYIRLLAITLLVFISGCLSYGTIVVPVTGSKGTLTSPGYENGTYPSNANISWVFEAPHGKVVKIEIVKFDMNPRRSNTDCLRVYDGDVRDLQRRTELLRTYWGYHALQASASSGGRYMTLHFSSGSSRGRGGFILKFSALEINVVACSDIMAEIPGIAEVTWSPAVISYPQFNKSRDILCSWRIIAPTNKTVRVNFYSNKKGLGKNLRRDKLLIFDGWDSNGKLIGSYSGRDIPRTVQTVSQVMYVRLASYQNNSTDPTENLRGRFSFIEEDRRAIACSSEGPAVVTSQSGTILSPEYEHGSYPYNATCAWKLVARPDQIIHMTFRDLSVGIAAGCGTENVSVYDGGYSHLDEPIERLCGDHWLFWGHVVTSRTNIVHVVFTSNSVTADKGSGFRMSYSMSHPACIRNNPPRKVNTSTSITSPNYGRGHYPPNSHCKWNITTDPGFVVNLTFVSFDTEYRDKVIVYNGDDVISRLSGSSPPSPQQSTISYMPVHFISDYSIQKTGFNATISFVNVSEHACVGSRRPYLFSLPVGEIASPGFRDQRYTGGAECHWRVSPRNTESIRFVIETFDLRRSSEDCLMIYEGADQRSNLVLRQCGCQLTSDLTVTAASGSAYVVLKTSQSQRNATGFYMRYTSVQSPFFIKWNTQLLIFFCVVLPAIGISLFLLGIFYCGWCCHRRQMNKKVHPSPDGDKRPDIYVMSNQGADEKPHSYEFLSLK